MRSAEQSVVGTIILDGNKYLQQALLILSANDFEDMFCRKIFETTSEIDSENKKINAVTIEEKLGKDWREQGLEAAEVTERISDKDFAEYVRVVKESSQMRQVRAILCELLSESVETGDMEQWREELTKALSSLNNNTMNYSVSAKESFLYFMEAKDKPREYFKSGFPRLDKVLKIGKGNFIVVGGRPSAGKTAFTLQMTLNMARKYKVVYFSLETDSETLTERLIANRTGVSFEAIKSGGEALTNTGAWEKITSQYNDYSRLNFVIVPAAGWTVSQIKAKAVQENADIVFIDYLGLIKSKARTMYEKATEISNDLHIMAQQTGIATVALAQLNRQGAEEPNMTSLRDSGAIEQDSDAIILLTLSEDESANLRDLLVVKNKNGENNQKISLEFNGSIQRFSELDSHGQIASEYAV